MSTRAIIGYKREDGKFVAGWHGLRAYIKKQLQNNGKSRKTY